MQIYNNSQISHYNYNKDLNFQGGLRLTKEFAPTCDVVTLAPKINNETLVWLKDRCKQFGKDSVQKAYDACLNSDNNISEHAINLLKKYVPEPQGLFSKFYTKSAKENVIKKFGLDFMSYLLMASRNNQQDHTSENIDFLDKVLTTFKSDKPVKYLDIIVNSKDSDGNVCEKMTHLYDYFLKTGNINNFVLFIKDLMLLPIEEQNLIAKYFTKIKHNDELFKILDGAKGSDSSKLIKSFDTDLNKYEINTIKTILCSSKTKQNEPSYENYKKLLALYKENEKLFSLCDSLKDRNGIVRDENIALSRFLCRTLSDIKNIKVYLDVSKDKDGVAQKDFAENLVKVLKENKTPDFYTNIIYCIEKLKNNHNEIQWEYVNIFSSLKNVVEQSSKAVKNNVFDKILTYSKDKNGDIIPEFVPKFPELIKKGLVLEIPNVIKLSKINDKFNQNNYTSAVNLIEKTASDERYEMSEFLFTCLDTKGDLDNNKIGMLNEIQKRGIAGNIIKIAASLKNPDNSFSQRGLDLAEHLRKNSHHQIEEDLPKIISLCRDKSGYLNDKTITAVKSIQTLKPHIQLSQILKMTLNSDKEVDDNKLKVITTILKEMRVKDAYTISKIVNAAKDKYGVIDLEVLKLAVNLSKQNKDISDYTDVLPAYRNLYKYEHVTHLSQLNLRQKRTLMRCLQRYKNDIQSPKFREILNPKILPNNHSEYCSLLAKLSHSIGTNVKPLSRQMKKDFCRALKHLADKNQDFMHLDFDHNAPVLELTYSLKDFKKDIWQIVKGSHYSDRTKALDYFGFELKDNNGHLELTGFPSAEKPDGRLAQIKDKDVLNLIKKVTPQIIKFTQNNNITIKNKPQLSKDLTDIIRAFPEFLTTIGKEQHETHDFTLDVHCLKVLQGVMKNSEFSKLSESSKRHIQIIALLHDLTKEEGKPDRTHPENSAFDVYYLLNKLGLKEKDKLKIYHVIKNHSWLANYDFDTNSAKHAAFNMREGNAFKMLMMLTEADLRGVKRHDAFYLKHAQKLDRAKKDICPYLNYLKETDINLPQTKIPKASELNKHSSHVRVINSDGITNTVLELQRGMDLRHAGFKTIKNVDDLNLLVHGLDSKDSAAMFQALGMIDSKALLSTSYVYYLKGNFRAFRQEGFVLNVPAANIHVAYWRDFGSGCKKTTHDLYDTYLFQNNPMREYISDQLKKELHLKNKEYADLFSKIEDLSIEELDFKYPKVAKAYRRIFQDMDVSKRSFDRNYNEILVTSPKIQAIFCYDKRPEYMSKYLREYAERNDVPIIVFS